VNVPYRYCPDTLSDPYGQTAGVPSGNARNSPPPTGPNEVWWAPYDPTEVPDGLPGAGYRSGLLYPFLTFTNVFKCPVERKWQCGYGMNYTDGSSMAKPDSFVTQPSDRLVVWDHRRSPGCSDSRVLVPPRPPWLPFTSTSHYPPRHGRGLNGLFYDGHAGWQSPESLRVNNFREPGSPPVVPEYPGE